ncbi:uncharacterized protein LOC118278103 [Spodoptera frugiperda]|uniref:Uncharacterized protein LOC118278103 n=1 Tax=Spodoptera frugiperda TaxID=7108 RepID=A0A9R0DH18_SPOFR|nr:uncharacterized protein LOC118278103 [Spodoptera frugiperda]
MLRINVAVAVFIVNLIRGWGQTTQDPRVGEMLLAKRYQMECIEETRVDPDIIAGIKNGRWSIPWNARPLAMKWALCVMMKRGLMTKEGVYKLDVALRMVPREERDAAEKLIDSCLSPKAIPAENIAFEFIHCFQDTKSNYSVSIFI